MCTEGRVVCVQIVCDKLSTTNDILVADVPLKMCNVSLSKHPLHAGIFLTVSRAAKQGGVVVMAAMAPSHQEATPTLARGRYTGRT